MASEEKTRCQLNSILELEIVNQEPHLYSRICIPEGTILGVVTDLQAAGNVNHQVLAFARMMRIEEQEMSCTPGNVVARQVDGQLFYQTSTTINKGVELSVCSEGAHAITSLLAAASSNGHIGEENTDVFKLLKRQSDSGQPSTATSESESASRTHQMIIPTSTGPGWSGVAEDSDGEEIWCEHCGADFVHHSDLHRHECPEAVSVSDHESGGLHVCRDCDKAFATSSGLKQHAHIHATVKPYVCEVCNKSYTQFSNLCRHKRIHSDCRLPVQCNGCSQKFVSTTALGKHRRFCGVKSPTDLQTADKAGNSMSFAEFGRLLPEQHQAILLAQLAASRSHSARNLFHPYLMHPLNARGLLPMSHSPESGRSLLKVAAKIESDGEGSPRSSDASDRKYLSDRSRDSCSPQPHTTTQNISGDVSPVPESLVSEVQSRREDFDDSRLHRHISSLDEGTTHHNIDGCVEISGAPLDLRISAKKTATETAPAESSTSPRSSPQPTRVGSASPVGPPASAFSNLPPSATAAANLCLNFNINHWLNLSRLLPSATLARLPFLSHPGLLAPQLDKGMQSFSGSPTATQTFLSSQANGPGVLLPNQFGVTPNSGRPPVSSKAKDRYACRYCGKIFPRSANLTRHLRTHTGEQPYKCQYCERSFSISSNLQRHVRNIHNKEKPYKCHLCDRCFGQQTNLDRHLKKHDSDPAESSGVSLQMEKPDSSAQTPPLLHSDDALPSAGSEDIITACKFAEQLQSLL